MESLNGKRIAASGLLAGLVMILGEVAGEPLMGAQTEALFGRLGLAVPGEAAMLAVVASSIVLGIVVVWLYAVLKDPNRPGRRHALVAAVVVWLLSCLLPSTTLYAYGIITGEFFAFAVTWPLLTTAVAALAGAWMYERRRVPIRATSRA